MAASLRTLLLIGTTLACAALCSADSPTAAKSQIVHRTIAIAGDKPKFLLAGSDGKIKPFTLPPGTRCGSAAGSGSDDPLLSPDGQKVALIRDGVLMIHSLQGGSSVTASARYPHEMFLITGWSPDSQSLIYHLSPPEGEDPQPSKIERPQHFVYNLPSERTWEIDIAGSFAGWLHDGAMLIQHQEDSSLHSQALVKGAVSKRILKPDLELGQISLHPNGQSIAANSNRPNDTSSSRLIKVDFPTGKITPLRDAAGWAETQWPKWSPSGRRIAWLTRVGLTEGIPKSVVTVGGAAVCSPRAIHEYHWLGDDVLAIVEAGAIVLIDAKGDELARQQVGREGP